jgi:hypothetical protein
VNLTVVESAVASSTTTKSAATTGTAAFSPAEQAAAGLMERRRRRREALTDRTRSAESVQRFDQTLWPDSVANPERTRVR